MAFLEKHHGVTDKIGIQKGEIQRLKKLRDIIKKELNCDLVVGTSSNNFDITYYEGYMLFCTMPVSLWEKIKLDVKKQSGDYKIKTVCESGFVELRCRKRYEKKIKNTVSMSLKEYFKNAIVDGVHSYKKIKYNGFPELRDLKNYSEALREMLEYAIEGFLKSKSFKIMLLGNPGTGKTWFSKILSKHLLKRGCIETALICSVKSISVIVDVIKQLKLNINILFIVDEMEYGTLDRQMTTQPGLSDMLHILDGIDKINNIKFLGISNLPQIMDKAIFRPERMDLLIKFVSQKIDIKFINNIFKSLNYKINTNELKLLSSKMYECFKEIMPLSFYTQALRLYDVYKNTDKVIKILKVFYQNKKLYQYNDGFCSQKKADLGFVEGSPEQAEYKKVTKPSERKTEYI